MGPKFVVESDTVDFEKPVHIETEKGTKIQTQDDFLRANELTDQLILKLRICSFPQQ